VTLDELILVRVPGWVGRNRPLAAAFIVLTLLGCGFFGWAAFGRPEAAVGP
jgi:hypothetical protein